MKKTLITYLIIPGVMLGVFIFFYVGAVKEMEEKHQRQQMEKKAKDEQEKVRKAEIEKRAIEDADKRQKQRDAEEAAKLAKKEADYQGVMTQLRNETADLNGQSEKLAKEVGSLEINIAQSRTAKEKLSRETFELAKDVELAKIHRRSAEIEILRTEEMAIKKMEASPVATIPLPPLPPSTPK
jgi:hypothetical protein